MLDLRRIIGCAMLALAISAATHASVLATQQPLRVHGQIPEMTEGEILLVAQRPRGLDTIGRAPLTASGFVLEADLEEPLVARLLVAGYEGGFLFIAEPGQRYDAVLTETGTSSIRGGHQQEAFFHYQAAILRHNERLRTLRQELAEATQERRFRTASEINKRLDTASAQAAEELNEILSAHRGSTLSAYVLTEGIQPRPLAEMERLYAKLNEQERQTQPAQLYAAIIAELQALDVGSNAPDFRLADQQGTAHELYEISGKLKIIDFWASWCGPCRLENPNMVRLYADFQSQGLEIIGVSLDVNEAAWKKAIQDDGLTWIHLIVPDGWKSEVVQQYHIDAVPTILILDESNKIIAKNLRGPQLRAFVSDYLSEADGQ